MARSKHREPPPGSRLTSADRITITIPCEMEGKPTRLSQHSILPSEPKSYATVDEAWAGYNRVLAYLAEEVDRGATVGGFWDRWTNEDDRQWGANGTECPDRSEHAIYTYASKTRAFKERYEKRTLASMCEADIRDWTQDEKYAPSGMTAIGTFLRDAATAGLRAGLNPATTYAKKAEAYLAAMRKKNKVDPPRMPEVDKLLAHLCLPAYPRSLYGWFLTGTRTGMRGGEIDGMQFRYVDGDVYQIDWQLHERTGLLDRPKHDSMRPVGLDHEILAEIEYQRQMRDAKPDDFIWLNTFRDPWRHNSRGKWWDKTIAGITLHEIVGGGEVTMYNATRHHWASWAVNEGGMSPYLASILYGHKDGGKLIAKTYADPDEQAALAAARRASSTRPADLTARRRAA